MAVNSRLKATKIMHQRKALYRKRIRESSCARKETVDIDILVTSRNGDRKIMQSIRITSRPPSRKRKWNQLSQFWRTSTKVIPIENISSNLSNRRWFLMGSLHNNFQVMLEFLTPFLVLHFSYYTLITFLILSVILLSADHTTSVLSVIRHLIRGSN